MNGKKVFFSLLSTLVLVGLAVVLYKDLGSRQQPQVNNNQTTPLPISIPLPDVLSATTSARLSLCKSVDELPDPICTPGVIDPRVTQDNIQQTICVPGYTKTVRPPASLTNNIKIKQIQEYGYIDVNPSNYEEDHLISLELGGSPSDPKNLWPEFPRSPNTKDKIENVCHKKLCSGLITLQEVQKQISSNWHTACQ